MQLVISFLLAGFLPWVLGLVSLNERTDVFFYVCAVLVAGGGAITSVLLLTRRLEESVEERNLYATAMPVMVGSTVIACLVNRGPLIHSLFTRRLFRVPKALHK